MVPRKIPRKINSLGWLRETLDNVSQHVSFSGYLLGEVIEPPSNAQHWSEGSARAGAAGVWRRNRAGDVSIMSQTSTREKEKLDYLVLVSRTCFSCGFVDSGLTNLVFLWICGQTRQVIAEGEG